MLNDRGCESILNNRPLKIFLPQKTQNNANKQDDFYYLRFSRPLRLYIF